MELRNVKEQVYLSAEHFEDLYYKNDAEYLKPHLISNHSFQDSHASTYATISKATQAHILSKKSSISKFHRVMDPSTRGEKACLIWRLLKKL
nr:hypothetical protein [Tanacetum cinerariifolium]